MTSTSYTISVFYNVILSLDLSWNNGFMELSFLGLRKWDGEHHAHSISVRVSYNKQCNLMARTTFSCISRVLCLYTTRLYSES